jgi:opacity protein-like surface antigen
MKKKLLLLVFTAFVMCQNMNAQALEKGKSVLQVGYGFGSGWSSLTSLYASNSGYKTSSFGPIASSYEYMITDKIGIGAGFNYASASATWTQEDQNFNFSTGAVTTNIYEYTWKLTVIQFLGRANYHFPIKNDKLDLYGGLGLGFTNFGTSWESTDPDFDKNSYNISLSSPFGYSLNLGARYFFTNNIGAYAELGYGISYFNAGLAFKF